MLYSDYCPRVDTRVCIFKKHHEIIQCNSNTLLLIKKGEGSPVETAFRRYLEDKGYDSIFVWSTFVSKNLSGNGIVKGKPVLYKNRNCKRYDYKKKIDGKQYTVYNMYLDKAEKYSAEYRRRNS